MIRFLNVYYPTRSVLQLLSEAFIICCCYLAAAGLVLRSDTVKVLTYEHNLAKVFGLTLVTVAIAYYCDLYEPQMISGPGETHFRILLVLGLVSFLASAVLYLFPSFGIARYITSAGIILIAVALIVWRQVFEWMQEREMFRERVVIFGSGTYAQGLANLINSRRDVGMELLRPMDADGNPLSAGAIVDWIEAYPEPIHRIIVAMEDRRGGLPVDELLAVRFRGIQVEEASALFERLSGKIELSSLRPSSFLYSEGFRIQPSQLVTRRLASVLAAGLGLLTFAPFFPLVALLVKLTSPGPLFFKQIRVGEGGKPFNVYKFRSMRTDAEKGGARFASKNDPRVTKIGMFMRKTRIDEVPQLWNVLRGDMGFVGPRPERPEFVPWLAEQLPYYNLRHLIRPGLTGWAQVRYGYGATLEESREKLQYDLYYVKHSSLGLDLLIMFETIKIILRRRGAQ
ncbi:sugar transferase, PEP-CTERM system associated/exopolysaccharide biosynthesis polyprenyl glycosylphosphotransferase [Terriglobus roseus DSM 18391]|uniref:Sugar transferase, PEP-CTERM system associated/exopolysaccharide biosynthesis polyprenyl glycosylphosphotransferase n=1 Tax=Terriglobus roseus (strain DSM 18391 / NRRL B-41598 / KBS 63) TaxID=926566 RepID=I3ZIJ4_TERRK|nr:TIGR03013 family XrtA/PEP-CTERM system glycosyltransferase [Terriglobus roseus]AFL89062.1 sugar transferase, PEP-CTERM system associated/exopolysaccharide biosynthesis polyprenyl glycosylphosphotransferase [Terriglobus roseus DSM 18391]